ncbi:NAD-dependent epimerase/dehydratase family protein [Gemmata sp.]|uniref:NAD-dependent epimerase/dehydratase family protein n=1 Tax=Gemmata sp. TaxID=1914242 RepID=UPI003F72107B
MNRLLVTGATGFIGTPCVRLAAGAFEVHAAARTAGRPLAPGIAFHRCDLLAPGAATRLVEAVRPTHLLHLAWVATPGVYWESPENHRWVAASQELLRAFAQCGGTRAVIAGTCAEYDWAAAGVCRENETPTRPGTTYGRCKLSLSHWAGSLGRERGVSVAWARLFWLYGPGEHPARLVPSVARSLLAGRPVPCTAGTQVRDFLHVDDAAAALVSLAAVGLTGEVNIGSCEPIAVREVIGEVARACGRPELVMLGERPTPASEPPMIVADVSRLRTATGWSPSVDLATGVRDTVNWWRGARAA